MAKKAARPEDGFDDLFCTLLPRLYRRAALLAGRAQLAEDCVHEAYLKLARHPDRLLAHPEPYAYAFTAMLSALRDALRRDRGQVPLPEAATELLAADGDRADGIARRAAELEAVRLLGFLSVRQASAVLLVDLDGYTIDQAAEIMRVHRGTVSRSRARALDRLRHVLTADQDAGPGAGPGAGADPGPEAGLGAGAHRVARKDQRLET